MTLTETIIFLDIAGVEHSLSHHSDDVTIYLYAVEGMLMLWNWMWYLKLILGSAMADVSRYS
jgi:hypothetical protein